MPLTAPLRATETWFKNVLVPFLNGLEDGIAQAGRPEGGWLVADLSDAVKKLFAPAAGVHVLYKYDGTNFVSPTGVIVTAANSTVAARGNGELRIYLTTGIGPDPNALGFMVDGDAWDTTQ